MEQREKILVIDPDVMITSLLKSNLGVSYDVDVSTSAENALELPLEQYSLLLLDVSLGGAIDGLQFVEMLRRHPLTARLPFIFVSARDSEDDIIRGFDAGADDYIVKPFSLREVMARVRSLMRRHAMQRPAAPAKVVAFGGLSVDFDRQRASIDGENASLSRTEFQLLSMMARKPGKAFSRDDMRRAVWPDDEAVSGRTVDVNISRLRKKLGPYSVLILSVPGSGYMLDAKD